KRWNPVVRPSAPPMPAGKARGILTSGRRRTNAAKHRRATTKNHATGQMHPGITSTLPHSSRKLKKRTATRMKRRATTTGERTTRDSQVKTISLLPLPATTETTCLRHRPPLEAAKERRKIQRLLLLQQNRPRKNWPVK